MGWGEIEGFMPVDKISLFNPAPPGADPVCAIGTLQDAGGMVIAQTVGIGGIVADTQKRCPLTLKDADPVTGGNPQASGIIFDKVIDRIAAQAGAIRRIMLITGEVILLPVVAIESIARSGKP